VRVIELRLASRPEAVAQARLALDDLRGKVSEECLEDARLLVSELVTNSVRHGHLADGQSIDLRVELDGEALRVEVRDTGGGFELQPRLAGSQEDSGWGLYLVGRLAERWGVSSDGSTSVWFEIPAHRGADRIDGSD
jgi:anti-sigma regulatory factor (Ser/Thr protein kinase)